MFSIKRRFILKKTNGGSTLTFSRSITRKSVIKKNGREGSLDSKASAAPMSAQGKGISRLRKDNKKTKSKFIHDYSVFPETLQYRLPLEEERGKPPKEHSNIIKLIFEQGGVESMAMDINEEKFNRYPITNPSKLNKRKERPLSVKMLSSDFIEDSLYNVNYGYFSKEVVIFQPDKAFDYNHLAGQDEFMQQWLQAYDKYDQDKANTLQVIKRPVHNSKTSDIKDKGAILEENKAENDDNKITKPSLQLWHTPTELFQPYYGEGLAKYILESYKSNDSGHDLIIYEVGAGNGTLMLNILDYLENTNLGFTRLLNIESLKSHLSYSINKTQDWRDIKTTSRLLTSLF